MALQFLPLLLKLHNAVFASGPTASHDEAPCGVSRIERLETMMEATRESTECPSWIMAACERIEPRPASQSPERGRHAEFT